MPCPLCSEQAREAVRRGEPLAENYEPQNVKKDGSFREAWCPDCRCRGRHRAIATLLERGEWRGDAPVLLCGAEPEETAMFARYFANATVMTKFPDPELYPDAVIAEIAAMPMFGGAAFRYFFASGVFDFIPDLPPAFAELRRVMQPGGEIHIQIQPFRIGDFDEPVRVRHRNALNHEAYSPTLDDGTTGIPHCFFDRRSFLGFMRDAGFDARIETVPDPISPLEFEIFIGQAV